MYQELNCIKVMTFMAFKIRLHISKINIKKQNYCYTKMELSSWNYPKEMKENSVGDR